MRVINKYDIVRSNNKTYHNGGEKYFKSCFLKMFGSCTFLTHLSFLLHAHAHGRFQISELYLLYHKKEGKDKAR